MEKLFTKGLIEKTSTGAYRVLASTSAVDRQGDSIDQSGWDLGNYMKNPVMLWAHDYTMLPIAKATQASVTAQGLVLEYEFAPAEGNPMAQQVKELVDGGFLNAVSVGFMPLDRNGNSITKMELYEVSFVPVPANPQALQLMASKGIAQDVIAKFFTAKKDDEPVISAEEEKGAVSDEISLEEQAEIKWNNLDSAFQIFGAFVDVYLNDETDANNFNALLLETASLLTTLAQGNTDDDEESAAITAGLKEALIKGINADAVKSLTLKMGAKHSKDTIKALNAAMVHCDEASAMLKDLVTTGDDEDGDESDAEDDDEEDGDEKSLKSGDFELRSLLVTQGLLRKETTPLNHGLHAVNALIAARA